MGGRRGFHEAAAGLYLDPASPGDWRKPDLPELCRLGIDRCFPRRFHASGVPGETLSLSILRCRFPTPVPESRRARHLRGITVCRNWRSHAQVMPLNLVWPSGALTIALDAVGPHGLKVARHERSRRVDPHHPGLSEAGGSV